MSNDQASSRQSRLEAYLDGRLGESDRAAFERELAGDPELRAAVERQREIDDALTALFPVPSPARLEAAGRLAAAATTPAAPRGARATRPWRLVAVAAAAALLFVGGWEIWLTMKPAKPSRQQFRTLATVYRDESRGDYKPQWVCANDEEFAQFVTDRFGHPLLVSADKPGDVEILGWSYANSLSPTTAYMLCRAEGHNVLVFVDLVEHENRDARCYGPPVFEFRRELGPFVFYELTPLDKPRVLPLLYEPDRGS